MWMKQIVKLWQWFVLKRQGTNEINYWTTVMVCLKKIKQMKQTTELWQWCILKKQGANEAHIKCKTKRLWVIACIGSFNWVQALMYIK
jgi:hypothetical protein